MSKPTIGPKVFDKEAVYEAFANDIQRRVRELNYLLTEARAAGLKIQLIDCGHQYNNVTVNRIWRDVAPVEYLRKDK